MILLTLTLAAITYRIHILSLRELKAKRKFDYVTNINGLKKLRSKLMQRNMTIEDLFLEAVGLKCPPLKLERIISAMTKFCSIRKLDWALEDGEDERYMVTISPKDESWFIQVEGPQIRDLVYLAVSQAYSNVNYRNEEKVINLNAWKGKNNG